MKYHINPVTGAPSPCHAKISCPFGDLQEDHYPTIEEARKGFERLMEAQTVVTHSQNVYNSPSMEAMASQLNKVAEKFDHENAKAAILLYRKSIEEGHDPYVLHQINNAMLDTVYEGDGATRAALTYIEKYGKLLQQHGEDYRNLKNDFQRIKTVEEELKINPHDRDLQEELELAKSFVADYPEFLEDYHKDKDLVFHHFANELAEDYEGRFNGFLDDGDELYNDGHYVSYVVSDKELQAVLGRGVNNIHMGEVSAQDHTEAVKKLQKVGAELTSSFMKTGKFKQPKKISDYEGPLKGNSDFVAIGGGQEVNVYLHEPSGMVFKIYHKESWKTDINGSEDKVATMQHAIRKLEERYQNVKGEVLDKYNAEYIPTYFITADDAAGEKIPMIVQPYLDPDIYMPTHGYFIPGYEAGVNDLHDGNVRVNIKTKRVVLFDCIL